MNYQIEHVRAAVADGLEARDIGDQSWRQDIREGRRDDTPFMIGALIWAQVQALTPAE
ncbi:hypothetical protein U5A82_17500 [Sphingobium sp. CR2-8]|uniref:hypothetical protein n=1 Tax=Sphingobium sp. CR2-8 TaxID=1306534 RepID=UPI002DBE5A9C|nr:hypothetical protein [Sphingobium sp. CR2-8]MEC3912205.1 hypothetical protein [Sphingobium sp. CR2-8]